MVLPPLLVFLASLFLILLTDSLERVGVEAAPSAAVAVSQHQRVRKAQAPPVLCGLQQCFNAVLGDCFHNTSRECLNPGEVVTPQPIPSRRPTPRPTPRPTRRPTPRPTQRQSPKPTPRPTRRPVTQSQTFEIPLLFRLRDVPENYTLSASDRSRFLSIIKQVLDEALDDPWKVMRVENINLGSERRRRMQSSLRGRGSIRRLNKTKTIYLPVLVTLRGEDSGIDVAQMTALILKILRNNLSVLLSRFKSLNPNAFQNLQISVEELNLANMTSSSWESTEGVQSTTNITITQTNDETTSSTSSSSDEVASFWVWLIVAAVCICMCFVIFMCMCRDCVKSRDRVTKDEDPSPNQMAVLYGYSINSNGDRNQQYLGNSRRQNVMMHSHRRSRSEEASRRRRSKRSQSDRMVRRSSDGNGYISSEDVDMNRFSSRRSSTSVEQERALTVLPPRRASFCATSATEAAPTPPRRASFNDTFISFHNSPKEMEVEKLRRNHRHSIPNKMVAL